jgi:hypothetical protein
MERILQTRGVYQMNLVAWGMLYGRLRILHGVQGYLRPERCCMRRMISGGHTG